MKKTKTQKSERGQAIIIIALAIIGLIAFTALAVDGGLVFSDQRNAQNAADTAVFAAARAKHRGEEWKTAGLLIANANSYDDGDFTVVTDADLNNVEVYGCDEDASSCGQYAGDDEYIQVRITSTINAYFAPAIGFNQFTNVVDSIAHASPNDPTETIWGNAVMSLMAGCKPNGYPHDPYTVAGNATSVVGGAGIFVNSNCGSALTVSGSSLLTTDGHAICTNGTSDGGGTVDPAPVNCNNEEPYPPGIIWPNPSCSTTGVVTYLTDDDEGDPIYYATAGNYSGDFPPSGGGGVPSQATVLMGKGVFCIDGDFSPGAGQHISSDLDDSGSHDYITEGVLIYVPTGSIGGNAQISLDIHAMDDPTINPSLQKLLFFQPIENDSGININGGADVHMTGSIWSPGGHISLSGNAGAMDTNGQVIGYSVFMGGSAGVQTYYDETNSAVITTQPTIELAE